MFKALRSQITVISALTIRGMQSAGRKLNYGYAWTFVQPIVMIAFFRVMMRVTGLAPAGMGVTTFLVLGTMGIFTFSSAMSISMKPPKRGLSVIPRVTVLDMFLAQGILVFITYDLLFWLFVIPASLYDGDWPPQNAFGVQAIFIADWLLGLSFAIVFNAISRIFPPASEFKKMLVRPIRLISGMFFVITSIPTFLWPWFTWNPVMHVCELLRSYWFVTYVTPIGSFTYVMVWVAALAVLGLTLERYVRRMIFE